MSADVWFKRDIQNALLSVSASGLEIARVSGDTSYLQGYLAAIRATALIFGIPAGAVLPVVDCCQQWQNLIGGGLT